jgi:hypothetical protein
MHWHAVELILQDSTVLLLPLVVYKYNPIIRILRYTWYSCL